MLTAAYFLAGLALLCLVYGLLDVSAPRSIDRRLVIAAAVLLLAALAIWTAADTELLFP